MTIKRVLTLSLIASLSLGLGACQSEDPSEQNNTSIEQKVDVKPQLVSIVSSGRGASSLTFSMEVEVGEDLRSINQDEDEQGAYTETNVVGEETAHCVIRQKGNPSATTYVDITWKGRGSKKIRFDKIKVQLPQGVSFDPQGEWYISGIIGGTSFDMQNGRISWANGNSSELSGKVVPYALPWTRLNTVSTNGQGDALLGISASFRPLGAVLRLQFYSNMLVGYQATGVSLETNALRATGVFDPMSTQDTDLSSGQYPQWRPTDTDATTRTYSYSLATESGQGLPSLKLPAGVAWDASRTIVLWGMPIENNRANRITSVKLRVRPLGEDGNIDLSQPEAETETYRQYNHREMVSGRTYRLSNVLTSDPIISEVYYQQTAEGDPDHAGAHNYSIVELYNPTSQPIDLRQYALARLRYEANVKKYLFYRATEAGSVVTDNPKGATMLPLLTLANATPGEIFGTNVGDYTAPWRKLVTGNASTTLEPGKTVLIGAGGYVATTRRPDANLREFDTAVRDGRITAEDLNHGAAGSSKYVALQTKLKSIEKAYLPSVGGQIDSAITKGYCQGLVAIDNSIGAKEVLPRAKGGGNLQLGPGQGVGLIKRIGFESGQVGNPDWVLVDLSVPLNDTGKAQAYVANLKAQLSATYDGSLNGLEIDAVQGINYVATRRKGNDMASTAYATEGWTYTRSENEGVKSLGTRSYVAGRTPYALNYVGYSSANNPKQLPYWSGVGTQYTKPSAQWNTLPAQGGGNTTIDVNQIKTGRKLRIVSGSASSYQGGSNIDKSFDGDLNTMYHSNWSNGGANYFPITLTYNLSQSEPVDHMIYYPRQSGGNGLFKLVDIYSVVGGQEQLLKSVDFGGSSSATKIVFDSPVNTSTIKLVVRSGAGDRQGFASVAEMEFYAKEEGQFDYTSVFTDPSCSELRSGVTEAQIKQISEPLFRDVALQLYQHKYKGEFRINTYKAWSHAPTQQAHNKTQYSYSRLDNPTGIAVKEGENLIVCVGKTHGYTKLSILVQNLDVPGGDGYGGDSYPITQGVNKIKIRNKGLVYILYNTDDYASRQPIKVHFLTGTVNGYYDAQDPKLRDRWSELLSKANNPYFDVVGQYAHLIYPTIQFRNNTPDIKPLIGVYDKITKSEMELLGLYKYGGVFTNRMTYVVVYKAYMYATTGRTSFNNSTLPGLCQSESLKSGVWGVAHELGHMNQTRGLVWRGMTEVTTNIMSAYVQTAVYGNQCRLQLENRYTNAFTRMLAPKLRFNTSGPFEMLVPFWQLQLYFGKAKGLSPELLSDKGGFYPDVFQFLRANPTLSTPGLQQTEFAYVASKVSGLDLTDFFERWGFLQPVDVIVTDYANERLLITEDRANDVKNRIRALGLPKPEVNLHYISDETAEMYRNPSSSYNAGQVRISGANRFTITGNQNIVAYEFINASGTIVYVHSVRTTQANTGTLPVSWVNGFTVKAVPVKGAGVDAPVTVQ